MKLMKIGELASLTRTSTRALRYYEDEQLLIPKRMPNGYRDYDPYLVDRVIQIRGLIDTGLPIRIIRQILPCLDKPRTIHFADATPEMLATLEHERDQMDERIEFLARNRAAITDYLEEVRALA